METQMQVLTISVTTHDVKEKIIWFLKHLESEGVEIVSQEDIDDLKLLAATRGEMSISFEEYLKNED
jgi:hypothetical protein